MPSPRFVRYDSDSSIDRMELIKQRKACGWDYEDAIITKFIDINRRGTLKLYWIFADATAEASVGHVGIMLDDHGGDLSVADPLQGIVTLSKFFVYPSQRGTGLGSASVRFIEDMARTELRARQITLNTLPADIAMDHERFTSKGAKPHQTYPLETWYARMGYKPYKREARYEHTWPNGEQETLAAVFMRKEL